MNDLFSFMLHDFKIAIIAKPDAVGFSDHVKDLQNLIVMHDYLYPGIEKWFQNKVIPGLKNLSRVAYVGYYDEKSVASAILKKTENSKICHIKISENMQGKNIGKLFTILMVLQVRDFARKMHLTMPEGLWLDKEQFFKSFLFDEMCINKTQYRKNETELRVSGNYNDIWDSSKSKLIKISDFLSIQGLSLENDLLMSIQPQFAQKIIDGKKKVEIRKKFDKCWEGKRIKIYASSPVQAIIGEARINKVVPGNPLEIWDKYNNLICCEKDFYLRYTNDKNKIHAILLEDVVPYKDPIQLSLLWYLTKKDLKPPQSHLRLDKSNDWAEAVSIATLYLNNRPLAMRI